MRVNFHTEEVSFFKEVRRILEDEAYRDQRAYKLFGHKKLRAHLLRALREAEKVFRKEAGLVPRRASEPWLSGEVNAVLAAWKGGSSLHQLVKSHHRTPGAIAARILIAGGISSDGNRIEVATSTKRELDRAGINWSANEFRLITEMQEQQLSLELIAKILHRRESEVRQKLPVSNSSSQLSSAESLKPDFDDAQLTAYQEEQYQRAESSYLIPDDDLPDAESLEEIATEELYGERQNLEEEQYIQDVLDGQFNPQSETPNPFDDADWGDVDDMDSKYWADYLGGPDPDDKN